MREQERWGVLADVLAEVVQHEDGDAYEHATGQPTSRDYGYLVPTRFVDAHERGEYELGDLVVSIKSAFRVAEKTFSLVSVRYIDADDMIVVGNETHVARLSKAIELSVQYGEDKVYDLAAGKWLVVVDVLRLLDDMKVGG